MDLHGVRYVCSVGGRLHSPAAGLEACVEGGDSSQNSRQGAFRGRGLRTGRTHAVLGGNEAGLRFGRSGRVRMATSTKSSPRCGAQVQGFEVGGRKSLGLRRWRLGLPAHIVAAVLKRLENFSDIAAGPPRGGKGSRRLDFDTVPRSQGRSGLRRLKPFAEVVDTFAQSGARLAV